LLLTDLSFWPLFIVLCVMSFFLSGQVPITESLAMQTSKGNLRAYGRMRVWGSIGFIVAVMLAGPWFDRVGIDWLPASLIAMLGLILVVTFFLPHREVHDLSPAPTIVRNIFKEKKIQRFLLASFLMLLAHAPLYTLFSLWLFEQGFTRTEIGLLWALGVVAEIAMFQFQHRLFDRLSVGVCWVMSYAVTAIRFLMIAFSGGSLWVIVLAQLLHAVTFGVHHSASMSLIRQWFPAQAQARGQAFYTGLGGRLEESPLAGSGKRCPRNLVLSPHRGLPCWALQWPGRRCESRGALPRSPSPKGIIEGFAAMHGLLRKTGHGRTYPLRQTLG
jgi:PPP family 3-phenylpropionic acid transporter